LQHAPSPCSTVLHRNTQTGNKHDRAHRHGCTGSREESKEQRKKWTAARGNQRNPDTASIATSIGAPSSPSSSPACACDALPAPPAAPALAASLGAPPCVAAPMVVRPERLVWRRSGHRPRAAWVCRRLQAGAGAGAPPGKAGRQEQEQKPGEGRPPASFDSGGSRVQGMERDRGYNHHFV